MLSPKINETASFLIKSSPITKDSAIPFGFSCCLYEILIPKLDPLPKSFLKLGKTI